MLGLHDAAGSARSRDTGHRRRRRGSVLGVLLLAAVLIASGVTVTQPAAAAAGEVLILDSTVSGGATSTLAQSFVAAGKTPVVVDDTTWASMSAAEFDAYDAIVLGDPSCGSTPPSAAEANATTWSSVVDGNVVVIGTDETFHQGEGGTDLMNSTAAFTVAQAGRTGAYISLSCYYEGTGAMTPVPLLDGFGTFTATGVGCYDDAHIVATHPALEGLTDATLSNWSCSVHEAFDSWPVSFEVLAIARDIGSVYTAPDGSVGTPYILARGVEVLSDIDLSPESATNPVGTSHTVTAKVTTDEPAPGTPVVGTTVTFTVVDGPHAGATGTADTDAAGEATFAYTGTTAGVDTIEATFVDGSGATQRSNRVTKEWTAPTGTAIELTPPTATNPVGADHTVTATVRDEAGAPLEGVTVHFAVTDGPNEGAEGDVATGASGQAEYTYTGAGGPGTDTIVASAEGATATATKTWEESAETATTLFAMNAKATLLRHGRIHIPHMWARLTETDSGAGVGGATLSFYAGEQLICTTVTKPSGWAHCGGTIDGRWPTIWAGYDVEFGGDATHSAATDHGTLFVKPHRHRH